MGVLLVEAISNPDQGFVNIGQDFVVVSVSVTDANGAARDGIAAQGFEFGVIQGNFAGGDVGAAIGKNLGCYAVQVMGLQAPNPGDPFPTLINGASVLVVTVNDQGDSGQALVQVNVSGRP
jgi:hypothetical protein